MSDSTNSRNQFERVADALDIITEVSNEIGVQLWDTIKLKEYMMAYRLNHVLQAGQSVDAVDQDGKPWEYKSIDLNKNKKRFIFKVNALDAYNNCEGIALASFDGMVLAHMYVPDKDKLMDILYKKAEIRKQTQLAKGTVKADGNDEVNISVNELEDIPHQHLMYYPNKIEEWMNG